MATNFATEFPTTELAARRQRLSFEHRFFLAVAVLFPLVNIIGFAPSYYFKTFSTAPPLPSLLVHVHGLVMTAWIILISVQATLISAKKIKLHMTLGILGCVVAAAVVVVGTMTGYAMFARGSTFPGYTPAEFFIIPMGDIVKFIIIFGAAIYYRKNAANHKRLILVTVLNFMPSSLARFPFAFVPELGAIWFLGVPALLGVIFLAVDTYRNGKMNRAFAAAVALIVAAGPVESMITKTEAWTRFAAWTIS